jgi:hypothetical protein
MHVFGLACLGVKTNLLLHLLHEVSCAGEDVKSPSASTPGGNLFPTKSPGTVGIAAHP